MNSVEVTSCSQSQGWPIVRVTMSKMTVVQKANSSAPHKAIKASSRPSKARHFKCDCRRATSLSAIAMGAPAANAHPSGAGFAGPAMRPSPRLLHADDQILDLLGMRPEVASELIQIRVGKLLESRFVDVADDLHADGLELVGRLVLELQGLRRLFLVDLVGRHLDPFLLLVGQAFPKLVAHPEEVVVRL